MLGPSWKRFFCQREKTLLETYVRAVSEPSWVHLGAVQGHLGAILGPSWAILGPSRGHLGATLGHLGAMLELLPIMLGHLGYDLILCDAKSAFRALASHKNCRTSSVDMVAGGGRWWHMVAGGGGFGGMAGAGL